MADFYTFQDLNKKLTDSGFKYDLDKIKSTVKEIWENQNIKSDIRTLKVEEQGAIVF